MNLSTRLLFCVVSLNLYSAISAETYNIHVKLADKKFDSVKGYLSLVVEFKNDKKKQLIRLTKEEEELKRDGSYVYAVIIENPVHQIKVANLLFQEASMKRFWPLRKKPEILVRYIEIEPVYIPDQSARRFQTKYYCSANDGYQEVKSEKRTSFKECFNFA